MYRLLIPTALSMAIACSGTPPSSPKVPEPGAEPMELAVEFWARLAEGDYEGAVSLASYPFDMDAYNGCVQDRQELLNAFHDDPLPADKAMRIGEARPVFADMDVSGLHEHWRDRIPRWTGPEAACLGDDPDAGYEYFLVDFYVNDKLVGALTRVRCDGSGCGVAGIEN